jgi:hypothetical protein
MIATEVERLTRGSVERAQMIMYPLSVTDVSLHEAFEPPLVIVVVMRDKIWLKSSSVI